MQSFDKNRIILNVTDRYTTLAESAKSCCEIPSSCCDEPSGFANTSKEYNNTDLSMLLPTVTDVSAGCGNPLSISSIKLNETVVDFGSGGGIDCFLAARQTGPNGRVLGVDMTTAMIDLANANKQKLGISNVEFIQKQIDNTGIENGSIDVILSNCVINLVPDKKAVFAEAHRILKKNGRFQICDIVTSKTLPDEALTDDNWCHCLSGAMNKDHYLEALKDVGFSDVQTISERVYQPDAEQDWMSLVYSISVLAIK